MGYLDPPEDPVMCDICLKDIDDCTCPECPECGEVGNMACIADHGLQVVPADRTEYEANLLAESEAEEALFADLDEDERLADDLAGVNPWGGMTEAEFMVAAQHAYERGW